MRGGNAGGILMTDVEQLKKWKEEEANYDMLGWDFSCVEGKWDYPNPPWDYKLIVKSYLKDADVLLDMGTGGGEVLLEIGHPYENTYVTEAYEPNIELCKSKLSPLGITVKQTFDDDKLPYDNEKFSFIINRHESFDLSEVNRTLKHGGHFITQQVGNRNFYELRAILNDDAPTEYPGHEIENYADVLRKLGFHIIMMDDVKLPVRIFNIGAVIFYAKACVWEVPKFSVDTHYDKLCQIQRKIDKNGFFQVTSGRFLLAARKL